MRGTNAVYKPVQQTGLELDIHETFETIQGEGPFAGWPALFIRLSHCNLRCWWCDTEFDNVTVRTVESLVGEVVLWRWRVRKAMVVVLTGGEPMAQNLRHLCASLCDSGFHVQIETAGTLAPSFDTALAMGTNVWPPRRGVSVVCSPKTPEVSQGLVPYITAYKYIIGADEELDSSDGLPIANTQIKGGRGRRLFRPVKRLNYDAQLMYWPPVYVQPRDDGDAEKNAANLERTVAVARQYGYTLSLQTHKMLGLP